MIRRVKFEKNNQFFLSISDLIMGLLLIFVLLYIKEYVKVDTKELRLLEIESEKNRIQLKAEKNKTLIKKLETTIEGHTDDLGSDDAQKNYLFNLDLSQKRADEVARFIYSDSYLIGTMGEERLSTLKKYLSSNGKSNANLIYKDLSSTDVDRDKSRRVTIKYRFDIQKMLKNSNGGNYND